MCVFSYICLLAALLASLGASGLALLQLWSGAAGSLPLIRKAQWLISACLLLASAGLLHVLYWQDYGVEYVAAYTDSLLPIFYRLTAFWAGQPGSMLFWALATALCGSLYGLTNTSKRQPQQTQLWLWAFFYAVMAFFCLVLTAWSNPFIMIEPAPADGQGLNPLLQNPGMILHPPLLFMGYAGFTIPACLALAQLLAPAEASWMRATRPFYLISWCLLTAGIALGAWWAYMELGWGGYWAWDPVENASLLPWLLATAALHILAIERRFGKLGRAAAALMGLSVAAAFFGTFLTRSGVIQSVHAFGDGAVGIPLAIFTAICCLVCLYIPSITKQEGGSLAQPASREGAAVLTAWLLLALAAIIALATMWPVISRAWASSPQGLDAAFYNRVCLPLATVLLILLAACRWLGWQAGLSHKSMAVAAMAVFAASACAIWALGYTKPLPLIAASATIAAIFTAIAGCATKSAWQNPPMLSAAGAHLGLALLALGVAFSGPYASEHELLLAKGQSASVGPYTATLKSIGEGSEPAYDYLKATLEITKDRKAVGILAPERRIYAKFGDMQFSEVDVLSSIGRDIYASLLGMDEDYKALVRISLEPLVNWIWLGGALMCILPLAGLRRML